MESSVGAAAAGEQESETTLKYLAVGDMSSLFPQNNEPQSVSLHFVDRVYNTFK